MPSDDHNLQRATSPAPDHYTQQEDLATESEVSQVSAARGEANSTRSSTDFLEQEIERVIRRKIRTGEIPEPPV